MVALALALGWLTAGLAPAASAEDKTKTERSNGRLEKYDKTASTVTIKDKGKAETFTVKAEGSVLTRTTVTVNSKPGKLDDLKEGAPVIVYWKTEGDAKFARKIDMPNVPKELLDEEEGASQ
jgi:spore germination protein GerM